MKNSLSHKLQEIQQVLKGKKLRIQALEDLKHEVKKAFDEAIDAIPDNRDIKREIREKGEQLTKWRRKFLKTIFPVNFRHLISMPFIYGMVIPLGILHFCIEIYHQVSFRLYNIPLVSAKEHFILDRQLLPYLNWFEKLNCVYCSYANNLIRYSGEIAGRTERFWCPIKYARRVDNAHSQYDKFVDFLDAEEFRRKWHKLRDFSDIIEAEKRRRAMRNMV